MANICVSYKALNRITKPFEYPIGWCDNTVEDFGDGAGTLFYITLDCAQGYHQIQVNDQEKLAFFAPRWKNIYIYSNAIWVRQRPIFLNRHGTTVPSRMDAPISALLQQFFQIAPSV